MTMSKILEKLRKENKDQYRILGICIFLSILLVSSYAMMYFRPLSKRCCRREAIRENYAG